ncbi:hypothetical protein TVAG_491170 [Trichomonas vaginalis G3]|uniref:Dynein heavy chain linker domain-containing protein n=1 Tax=Trichomonas vaginalis (strain ATCC PRA-98 / G3) TaxID=412133 RepID=A2E060_TRIV3|nr:dynein heavy chain family [Trichomonas vaginalis G3]EAY13979.1 hypothetical protein TVAG_491170 [Trichomonas vaginalis G3]KAI5551804.1 dynein heavy chain family [Trichomonas vaginalis G3]|eukprot:XP_001326202.1 hypothetical protein [Trichomonas vaginalis G3]
MKSQKQRFEEAFLKLQSEVQGRTKKTLNQRVTISKLLGINRGPLDLKPPTAPEGYGYNPRRKDTNTIQSLRNSLIKIHTPDPRTMKLSPRNSPRYRSTEIQPMPNLPLDTNENAPLPWNSRTILNYTQFEESLLNATNRMHKLVAPLKFDENEEAKHLFPLDYFDCEYGMSESEWELRTHGSPAVGSACIMGNANKYEWHLCRINSFDNEQFLYEIETFDEKPLIRNLSRFQIRFIDESPEVLQYREKLTIKSREDFEKLMITDCFLDSIPDPPDLLDFLNTSFKNTLTDEAKSEIGRVQKMLIFRGQAKLHQQDDLLELINKIGGDINCYSPTKLEDPFILDTSYSKSLKSINSSVNLVSSQNYYQICQKVYSLIYVMQNQLMDYVIKFFENKQYDMTEWRENIGTYKNEIRQKLDNLIDTIASTINRLCGDELETFDNEKFQNLPKNHPPLQFFNTADNTHFYKFKIYLKILMSCFARDLIEFNLNFYRELINYQINYTQPHEITIDGFTTIDQSVSDKSISTKKPFLNIELHTKRDDIKILIMDYFKVLDEELKNLVNPLRMIFDRTNVEIARSLSTSKYEGFCIDFELTSFIPPMNNFKQEEVCPIIEKTTEIFLTILSSEIQKIYNCFPTLLAYADRAVSYFTNLTIVPVEETYDYLQKIQKDKDTFLMNYPSEVWLGFSRLIFTTLRTKIIDSVNYNRETVLSKIQHEYEDRLEKLHQDYTDLTNDLKRKPSLAKEWAMLKTTVFGTIKVRQKLEEEAKHINELGDLLFSLSYGHYYRDLSKEMNMMMWPILTDIELGKALSLLLETREEYLNNNEQQIKQHKEDINTRLEIIKNTQDTNIQQQNREFVRHLNEKLVQLEQLHEEFMEYDFTKFASPRVILWSIVKTSQDQIEKWQKSVIITIDFNEAKLTCDKWLKQLRSLTASFKKDKNSLRLLISTKNDIENIIPIFKACTQSLTPKLLQNHRDDIVNIIGDKDFESKTMGYLISIKISEKLEDIDKLYKQAKLEDKADFEIINAQTYIKTCQVEFKKDEIVNISNILSDCRSTNNEMMMISATENIEEKKRKKALSIIEQITHITMTVEFISSIQILLKQLKPVQNVSGVEVDVTDFNKAASSFSEIIKELKQNPLILQYSEKEMSLHNLRQIKNLLKSVQEAFISALTKFREKIPRLLLVPDSKIIHVFSDDLQTKVDIIPTIFPGISEVFCDKNKIVKFKLDFEDEIVLLNGVSTKGDIISIIPKLEQEISSSLKSLFMKYYKENIDPSKIPVQLLILRQLMDPFYDINTSNMCFEKRRTLEVLKESLSSENAIYPSAKIDESEKVFTCFGDRSLEYKFQITKANSIIFTKISLAIIADLISNKSNEPLLIASEMYSTSSLICQQLSYICGRFCLIIHATMTTTIERLSSIIQMLNSIDIWTCFTDTELLTNEQMFELAMLVKQPFFLTVTTRDILPILSVGKVLFTISSDAFKQHVLMAGQSLYPYQPEAINFAATTLTNYIHPYSVLKYIEEQLHAEKVAFDLNFMAAFASIIPDNVYEIVKDTIDETIDIDENVFIPVIKSLISTTDFLNGVHRIMYTLNQGKKMILVKGQQYSGTSTCIMAAAKALGCKYTAVALSSSNWIKTINETFTRMDSNKTIFHVTTQFDRSFLAHVSALAFGSSLCEGQQNLLRIPENAILIFEVMTPMTTPELIAIPIISFNMPLVKSGELMAYWMANATFTLDSEIAEYIKDFVTNLISTNLQVSIFFNLFSAHLSKLPPQKPNAINNLIAYCAFWSNTFSFTQQNMWNEYSNFIIEKVPNLSHTTPFFDLTASKSQDQFTLASVYNNTRIYQFDNSLHTQYNRDVNGPISLTNIPTPQFIHGIEIIPKIIESGLHVAVIGPPSSGKTTIVDYVESQFFLRPKYQVVRIDGYNTTPEQFLQCLMMFCNTSVDGVVEPKVASNIIVVVDPMKNDGEMYGTIVSMIKTGCAIISNEVISFSKIYFIIVMEEASYPILTCCFPFRIQPYDDECLKFIAYETMMRIMVSNNVPQAYLQQTMQTMSRGVVELLYTVKKVGPEFLRTFFTVIRSVEMLDFNRNTNISDFWFQRLLDIAPHAEMRVPSKNFVYDLINVQQTGQKTFRYVSNTLQDQFERSLVPAICIFAHKLTTSPVMYNYCEFLLNTFFMPRTNAIVVNDLIVDYETITKFMSSALSAKFIIYNSVQQLPSLLHDSIVSSQLTVVYCRKPDPALINLLSNGLKSNQLNYLQLIKNNDQYIPESGIGNTFPYSNLARPNEPETKNKNGTRISQDDFAHYKFNMFVNTHFVFSVQSLEEIPYNCRSHFSIWDKHNTLTETTDQRINKLLKVVSVHNKNSLVPVIAQFPRVTQCYNYLTNKLKSFIEQRHTFLSEVMTVIESIENALKDFEGRIHDLTEQIKLDQTMKKSAENAVNNAHQVVANYTGELAKAESEYQTICENNNQLMSYMEKDGSKTIDAYKKAQRKAQKSFNADEQYKLYIQQYPSENIQNLFAAYCTLIGLSPRTNDGFWPEARGILKSGRIPNAISIFNPNDIPRENVEKFDVAMQKVNESLFPTNSPCYNFALWLKAIHMHTKRTNFNSNVTPKMSEILLQKSRKEEVIDNLKERLNKAKDDEEALQKSLKDLTDKINNEERLLQNITLFASIAKKLTKVFPSLKDSLNNFRVGEKETGKNSENFVLKAVYDLIIRPLFDPVSLKQVDNDFEEMMTSNFFDTKFFVDVKTIINTTDPICASILAGDRIISVYDPYGVAELVMGYKNGKPSECISHLTISYAESGDEDLEFKIMRAAEDGSIIVIKHADRLVDSQFFCAVANKAVTSAILGVRSVTIDEDFKAILLVDRPPEWMPPMMSFIAELEMEKAHIESMLAKDKSIFEIAEKLKTAEISVIQQRENLFLSLQSLFTQLKEIHSTRADLLRDPELQAELLTNAETAVRDAKVVGEHALDSQPWVREKSGKIVEFCGQLQSAIKIAPVYVFPLHKFDEILMHWDKANDVLEHFISCVASTMAKKHRNKFVEMKTIKTLEPKDAAQWSSVVLAHCENLATSAIFFTSLKIPCNNYLFITKETDAKIELQKLNEIIEKSETFVVSLFTDNAEQLLALSKFLQSIDTKKWKEGTKMYIHSNTMVKISPQIVDFATVVSLD